MVSTQKGNVAIMLKKNTISVLLVDDHEIVRIGFKRLIETTSDIKVVAEASCGEDAYNLAHELQPRYHHHGYQHAWDWWFRGNYKTL